MGRLGPNPRCCPSLAGAGCRMGTLAAGGGRRVAIGCRGPSQAAPAGAPSSAEPRDPLVPPGAGTGHGFVCRPSPVEACLAEGGRTGAQTRRTEKGGGVQGGAAAACGSPRDADARCAPAPCADRPLELRVRRARVRAGAACGATTSGARGVEAPGVSRTGRRRAPVRVWRRVPQRAASRTRRTALIRGAASRLAG